MAEYAKPLPVVSAINAPFWEATRRHELRIQQCRACHRFWYPFGPLCPHCWSRDYDWTRVSGRGRVSSWVVFHQLYFPGFKDELPYNVTQVTLDEGPRLLTNLVGVAHDQLRIGMPVEVVFEDVTDEVTLPKFRPIR